MLSEEGVAELAGDSGLDAAALFRETGGNAFFVAEVIASGGQHLPPTVQDAVLARVHRLSPQARLALESAAVIGSRVEPALVHGMPDVSADSVDECVSAGMLRFDAPTYSFRHELVRQSVLSGITPGRLGALHWQVLDRLRAMPMSPDRWLAWPSTPRWRGTRRRSWSSRSPPVTPPPSLGSHREAAFQYGRAMPYAELLETDARIALLGRRADECQVDDQHENAIAAWNEQLVLLRAAGRNLEAVDALLGLDQSYFTIGDNSRGTSMLDESFALLEGTGPSPQLARTLRYRGAHHLRASENAAAVPWLEQALEMARDLGATDVEARALASLGLVHFLLGEESRGRAEVTEGLQLALDIGEEDMAGSIYQTVAWLAWLQFDFPEGHAKMEEAERVHRRARPQRAPDVRAGRRDHHEARPRPVGRGDGRGARPALRAQHRPGQPDRSADGHRAARCPTR